MKYTVQLSQLGDINLSDKVVVSDPCYERKVWCSAKDIAVRSGEYATFMVTRVTDNETRVAALIIVHKDSIKTLVERLRLSWVPYKEALGVDSGQCGIFDDTVYPRKKRLIGKYDDENSFYGECCKLTISDACGGVLKSGNGVVSSSGFGDGIYQLLGHSTKGDSTALMIDFGILEPETMTNMLLDYLMWSDFSK